MKARLSSVLLSCLLLPTGCKNGGPQKSDAGESPQAAAEPAALVAGPLNQRGFAGGSGLRPKVAIRVDQPLPRDPALNETRDAVRALRPDSGASRQSLSFVAHLRMPTSPALAREANAVTIDAAKKRLELRLDGFAESAHLRITLGSPGFLFRWGTELRARADLLGAIIITPAEEDAAMPYRVVPHGAVRALLNERRVDVAPLSNASVKDAGDGPRRFGQRTRRAEVTTRAGKATIDLLPVRDLGEGGALLCFMLLDWLAAMPNETVCKVDEIPAYADFRWSTRGGILFEIDSLERRSDSTSLEVPPARARFEAQAPAPLTFSLLLTRVELAALHNVAVEVPREASDAAVAQAEGLQVTNNSDELRVFFLEGVPVAWLRPGAQLVVPALLHGRYVAEWRTFLGEVRAEAKSVVVPGVFESDTKAK